MILNRIFSIKNYNIELEQLITGYEVLRQKIEYLKFVKEIK